MFKKIHHVGLITDDMERTTKMFQEKLGCEPNRVQVAAPAGRTPRSCAWAMWR